MSNPVDDLTPAQAALYNAVRAERSGRDLADVLAEQDAPAADKAAVIRALTVMPTRPTGR